MKVQDTIYLKKPALVLIPENSYEKEILKRCLGSRSTLRVSGYSVRYDKVYPDGSVVLWDESQNRSECLPEQDGPGPEIRMVRKRADIGDFMNALRRYINNIIDLRLYETVRNVSGFDEEAYKDKIHEAAQELQKIIKPLFEEEIPG